MNANEPFNPDLWMEDFARQLLADARQHDDEVRRRLAETAVAPSAEMSPLVERPDPRQS